jgi:hypothetical protein
MRGDTTQSAQQQQKRQLMHWTRPSINWYKYNVDVGFQNKLGKTSMGWCIRDLMGQFALAVPHGYKENIQSLKVEP